MCTKKVKRIYYQNEIITICIDRPNHVRPTIHTMNGKDLGIENYQVGTFVFSLSLSRCQNLMHSFFFISSIIIMHFDNFAYARLPSIFPISPHFPHFVCIWFFCNFCWFVFVCFVLCVMVLGVIARGICMALYMLSATIIITHCKKRKKKICMLHVHTHIWIGIVESMSLIW